MRDQWRGGDGHGLEEFPVYQGALRLLYNEVHMIKIAGFRHLAMVHQYLSTVLDAQAMGLQLLGL